MSFVLLTMGADGRWHPGIGDPTAIGWLTVLAYALAAFFAYRAFRTARSGARELAHSDPVEAKAQRLLASLWLIVFATMVVLGINKQLDLQTLFTQGMRAIFFRLNMYDQRRTFQVLFIAAIALGALLAVGALTVLFWRVIGRALLAVVGLAVVVSFVVIRAASFHHVDLYLRHGPLPLNIVLELGGVLVLAYAGFRATSHLSSRGSASHVTSR